MSQYGSFAPPPSPSSTLCWDPQPKIRAILHRNSEYIRWRVPSVVVGRGADRSSAGMTRCCRTKKLSPAARMRSVAAPMAIAGHERRQLRQRRIGRAPRRSPDPKAGEGLRHGRPRAKRCSRVASGWDQRCVERGGPPVSCSVTSVGYQPSRFLLWRVDYRGMGKSVDPLAVNQCI
jgi:hypothetical protein